MSNVPATMRSLVAPKKCSPADYQVVDMPTPTITQPGHVLLRMRAAAINTGDTQFAKGMSEFLGKQEYPMKLGIEGSGVVVAVGSAVKNFSVGDEVYGFNMDKPILKKRESGFVSEYALGEERFLLHKPAHVSFEDAASFPGLVVTAMQTIRRGLQLRGEDTLEGKTVFVPAALSASGSLAVQVARNVFGASKIISTVSTPKMALVEQYLPGMVDQLVDYKKQAVGKAVGRGTVDFALSTQWTTLDDSIALLKPASGTLMSIASIPTKATGRELFADRLPVWLGWLLSAAQLYYWWKLRGTSIKYEFVSGSPNIREDLEAAGEVVARGKIRAVTTVVDLEDVDEVRKGCERVLTGKGGLGKFVIRISKE
ncbi:chaperonin 10-like protein [Thelonectria olida]|uniref:Chaperonin 10-like protein n=1 Tax=Thelonectria olida TaxID=1576542 RepID=A0A9P9AXS3_9HYPO|nr:chaperonin 10-like protein [Thelonectria olida]